MDFMNLYEKKESCCGCGACANLCPQKAITMKMDEYGFMYPEIDNSKCVKCGLCKFKCSYQAKNKKMNEPQEVYASFCKNNETLKKSASGGIFASIAYDFIKNGGIVYGCGIDYDSKKLITHHKRIDKVNEIVDLQGSKYVQSEMGNVYWKIKDDLLKGKKVLFSGTPCQVNAVKSYLDNVKEKDNLYTIDIICHGVPSERFFQDYLANFEKKLDGKIIDIKFRDKTEGWGLKGKITYLSNKNNKKKEKIIFSHLSSYYKLFLNSTIYRENCYTCKYACKGRCGDITIGDYWGIEKQHPEYLVVNGGKIEPKNGISCILVNTKNGDILLADYSNELEKLKSTFDKVELFNAQLKSPSEKNKNRKFVLNLYKNGGYKEVEKWFQKELGAKRILYYFWNKIPRKIQLILKKKG